MARGAGDDLGGHYPRRGALFCVLTRRRPEDTMPFLRLSSNWFPARWPTEPQGFQRAPRRGGGIVGKHVLLIMSAFSASCSDIPPPSHGHIVGDDVVS